jgi:ABC-type nickel/cobalt efflux system permease component RcnA
MRNACYKKCIRHFIILQAPLNMKLVGSGSATAGAASYGALGGEGNPEMTGSLLIATVGAVGVLHTLVPDHWAPIVVVARQQGWSTARTVRAAAIAALGHVTSTLALGVVVWAAGAALAARYGHAVNIGAALALIGFGLWIAFQGWRETRERGPGHAHHAHAHLHRHEDGLEHVHSHEHHDLHATNESAAVVHSHGHSVSGRTTLLLILGSSPMVEGIPAFLAASTYGPALLGIMAVVFAAATLVTYVATCALGVAALQRTSFGPLETYGEVLSGALVAAVGVYALITA